MRAGMSVRAIVVLVAVLLMTGTAMAADPTADPSASARASRLATSGSPSIGSSEAPAPGAPASAEASASFEPAQSTGSPATSAPSESPEASEGSEKAEPAEAPPTDAEIADFVGRLKAAGITTTAAIFKSLAARVGVGGAVRTLAFAQASGKTPAQILAMFEGGKGWGEIDHELGLTIGPGIGWIMSGGHGGHGGNSGH